MAHCQAEMPFGDYSEDHVKACLLKKSKCPNGCGKEISSEDFLKSKDFHFDEECTLTLIKCEGCRAVLAKKDKENHSCLNSLRSMLDGATLKSENTTAA
mmetsp:Transcript_22681/g.34970  ORF Transcript_22681/g.34970 Transcript_22681/m.34970 type:complete len:99 (+) Transcript_22681:356-652(+)|eukprot:CAMPEP_0170482084 /NCGR_PEP_ID=MMETSP0208-20121228/2261_1 /TAXON_ID=197538 /ORGANISM="Strombidium inclinatum, Strain S3" /LENGTH=98 /DNA_ID=CAMNT_0010754881 /DNA_START=307 /DNA_END=603 /DNA_ORIENTATION=+